MFFSTFGAMLAALLAIVIIIKAYLYLDDYFSPLARAGRGIKTYRESLPDAERILGKGIVEVDKILGNHDETLKKIKELQASGLSDEEIRDTFFHKDGNH